MVCVNAGSFGSKNYGYVGIIQDKMECLSCRYDNHSCLHMKTIEDAISKSDPSLPSTIFNMIAKTKREPLQMGSTSATGPLTHSHHAIPFVVPVYLQRILRDGLLQECFLQPTLYCMFPPVVAGHVCSVCGSPWSSQNPVHMNWVDKRPIVFTSNTIFHCSGTQACSIIYICVTYNSSKCHLTGCFSHYMHFAGPIAM